MLQKARSEGKKIGIIADGTPEKQRKIFEESGLNELVDDFIITDELGGIQFRKPCDIAFRVIQTRWKMSMSQISYASNEDKRGLQTARQLGMKAKVIERHD